MRLLDDEKKKALVLKVHKLREERNLSIDKGTRAVGINLDQYYKWQRQFGLKQKGKRPYRRLKMLKPVEKTGDYESVTLPPIGGSNGGTISISGSPEQLATFFRGLR